jgi:integrase
MNLARETAPHEWNYVEPYSGVAGSREGQLSLADHQRLLNAMKPDFRALAMASSFTAARHNELVTLKCKNFKNGVVIIEAQYAKNGKTRAIPLSSAGVEFFTQMAKGKMPDALIFTRSNGSPWLQGSQKRLMIKACITAGFTEDQRIRFHELKHVRVSMLSNAGLELDLLQAVVGNTDARTLADHYIHLKDERITSRLEAVAGEYDRAILKGASQRQVIVPLRRTRVPDEDE